MLSQDPDTTKALAWLALLSPETRVTYQHYHQYATFSDRHADDLDEPVRTAQARILLENIHDHHYEHATVCSLTEENILIVRCERPVPTGVDGRRMMVV